MVPASWGDILSIRNAQPSHLYLARVPNVSSYCTSDLILSFTGEVVADTSQSALDCFASLLGFVQVMLQWLLFSFMYALTLGKQIARLMK